MYGEIQDGAELFARAVEGQNKKHGVKMTLYAVLINAYIKLNDLRTV